ncbi:hypothetical protein BH09MYX1_BH09MYX1_21000 [soil metagenome]
MSSRSSPYPLSRMAPAFDLVDVAGEIQRADSSLASVTGGKLHVIAEQIRALQARAREILERTARDADLHRAKCNFEKHPGGVYHISRRPEGTLWFSLLAPEEWVSQKPEHVASYRLEADLSFTELGEIAEREAEAVQLARLLPRGDR